MGLVYLPESLLVFLGMYKHIKSLVSTRPEIILKDTIDTSFVRNENIENISMFSDEKYFGGTARAVIAAKQSLQVCNVFS